MQYLLVADNGSDQIGDGSEEKPFATFDKALRLAAPGDTIVVRGVLKRQTVNIDQSYRADAPLSVIQHEDGGAIDGEFTFPKPGANAKVMRNPMTGDIGHYGPLVRISGSHVRWSVNILNSLGRGIAVGNDGPQAACKNVELSDFTVDWSRNAGVHIRSAENLRCRNVKNLHAGCYYQERRDPSKFNWPVAFNVLYSKNILIEECESSYNWGEGFALGRGTSNSTVTRSVFANNMALNLYLHRCERVMATRNLIYCSESDPCPGLVVNNEDNFIGTVANNLLIAHNLAVGNRYNYAVWGNETSKTVTNNISFLFNTSITARGWDEGGAQQARHAGMLLRSRGARNMEVVGNLFYQEDGDFMQVDGEPVDCRFERNGWVGSGKPIQVVRSAGDLSDVNLVKPNAPVKYGAVQPGNYAPTRAYKIGPVDDLEALDYFGRARTDWVIGAIEAGVETPIIPDEPPDPTPEPLVLTLTVSGENAEQLRSLLRQARIEIA